MDGGSTDGTLAILGEYPGLIVRSGRDGGTPDAINHGFQLSRGEYFTYLNADDVLLPGAISAAVSALAEDPDAAGVYGDASWIDETGATIGPYPVRDFDPKLLESECFICQPASLLRSSAFEAAGCWNADFELTFDYEFWMRLSRIATLRRIPVPAGACPVCIGRISRWDNARPCLPKPSVFYVSIILTSLFDGCTPTNVTGPTDAITSSNRRNIPFARI